MTLYDMCLTTARVHQTAAVRHLVEERTSSAVPRRSRRPGTEVAKPATTARMLLPWRESLSPVPPLGCIQQRGVQASNGKQQRKVRELFMLAVSHFVDLIALGIKVSSWQNEAEVAAAEVLVMSAAARASVGHLTSVSLSGVNAVQMDPICPGTGHASE